MSFPAEKLLHFYDRLIQIMIAKALISYNQTVTLIEQAESNLMKWILLNSVLRHSDCVGTNSSFSRYHPKEM